MAIIARTFSAPGSSKGSALLPLLLVLPSLGMVESPLAPVAVAGVMRVHSAVTTLLSTCDNKGDGERGY